MSFATPNGTYGAAQPATGEVRERIGQRINARAPGLAQYEQMTDRVMPVIRLVPNGQRTLE